MKAPWIVVSAALAICALGAGYEWQAASSQTAALADQVASLKADNSRLTDALSDATEKAKALESESDQLRAARAITDTPVRLDPNPAAAPEEPKPKENGFGGMLAKMMKDPDMKKMIASQAASALRKYYSDFLTSANLTPDEQDQFFKILSDRQMAMMDSSAGMMSGSGVDMGAIQAAKTASDNAMQALLGSDRFSQYQAYEKTLGDRIQVQQFSQQLEGQGPPLADTQSQALIQIMAQENANLPGSQGPASSPLANGAMTQDQIDQYEQQVTAANQRIYNRAMGILSPPQLTAFGQYQKTMVTTQVAGLKMAQQMMKGQ